jgi:hypothetical protein
VNISWLINLSILVGALDRVQAAQDVYMLVEMKKGGDITRGTSEAIRGRYIPIEKKSM